MAQRDTAPTRHKRGPGRPPKSAPALKKQRLSISTLPSPAPQSPVVASPAIEKRRIPGLPAKVVDSKPLPTLPEPLLPPLSDAEYQSIATSAVLPASLDRSRLRWVNEGLFKRYWVKPETGKHAKPAPPDNPELKWMKPRGPCRIRIEPHIFEAEVYVEEKVKPQPAPKQYIHNTYAQPYRPPAPSQQPYAQPQPQPQPQPYQNRAVPSSTQHGSQQGPVHSKMLPLAQNPTPTNTPPPPHQAHPPPPTQADKKALSHDPVVNMLATRSSSDPELKLLMKEVATGKANHEQLVVFQKHIDELQAIIRKQNKEDTARDQQKAEAIRHDAVSDNKVVQHQTHAPAANPPQPQVPPRPYQPPAPQPPPPVYRQPAWTPQPPVSSPVILSFTTPGATEDRFLFPQHSILESLSRQHTLVSHIVTLKGREAADSSGLDAEKEYWQPVTMLVEVAYGREEILACIRRWVKPVEEVRKHMEEVMARCVRAPQTYLALRLPFKSTAVVEVEETPQESTPTAEERGKTKGSLKQAKKVTAATAPATEGKDAIAGKPDEAVTKTGHPPGSNASLPATATGIEANTSAIDNKEVTGDGSTSISTTRDDTRSKRPTRKSVRISEA